MEQPIYFQKGDKNCFVYNAGMMAYIVIAKIGREIRRMIMEPISLAAIAVFLAPYLKKGGEKLAEKTVEKL